MNNVATFRVETPLKSRKHHSNQQPQPVQQNYAALSQASPDFGSTQTMVPLPQILDINPRYGQHSTNQRVWVAIQNLARGNGEQYLIGFGHAGMVTTSFVSSEGDQVQILECTTPTTSTLCSFFLSLMHDHDPQTPIGSGHAYYTFC